RLPAKVTRKPIQRTSRALALTLTPTAAIVNISRQDRQTGGVSRRGRPPTARRRRAGRRTAPGPRPGPGSTGSILQAGARGPVLAGPQLVPLGLQLLDGLEQDRVQAVGQDVLRARGVGLDPFRHDLLHVLGHETPHHAEAAVELRVLPP